MLELPNLDDRDFDELVTDARSVIPRIFPEWTNHNPHDPGTTLLELMAWLVEMQQYYLNRIPDVNVRKFLKLLGVTARGITPARTFIAFDNLNSSMRLPLGSQVRAGDLVFETTSTVDLHHARLERLFVGSGGTLRDVTTTLQDGQLGVQPFGHPSEKGNAFYIGFSAAMEGTIRLEIQVTYLEGPTPGRIHARDDIYVSPVKLQWQYFGRTRSMDDPSETVGVTAGESNWHDLTLDFDDSFDFAQSGVLQFRLDGQTTGTTLDTLSRETFHFFRCILIDGSYLEDPRIQTVTLNAVEVVQQETMSTHWEFVLQPGVSEVIVEHALALDGEIEVQAEDPQGAWVTWQLKQPQNTDDDVTEVEREQSVDEVYELTRDESKGILIVSLGNAKDSLTELLRIRVIAFDAMLGRQRAFGTTTGLPNCQIFLPYHNWSIFSLQVSRVKDGRLVWEDWQYVEDFAASRVQDKHYSFDDTGEYLVFGNNERGLLPQRAVEQNVRVLALCYSRGRAGNIQKSQIRNVKLPRHAKELGVTNTTIGAGGEEAETLGHLQARMERSLQGVRSLVTTRDYEYAVRETPGLRVRHVQLLPLWVEGLRDYPNRTEPGHVSVVVSPYGDTPYTAPNAAFLETVRRHLADYRLLGLKLHVVGPSFVRVSVTTTIVVEPNAVDAQDKVRQVIDGYVTDTDDLQEGLNVQLGRRLYAGDVHTVLHKIPGVVFVQDARFEYQGQGVMISPDGDIILPPNGLAYPGTHQISLVSRLDLFPEGV